MKLRIWILLFVVTSGMHGCGVFGSAQESQLIAQDSQKITAAAIVDVAMAIQLGAEDDAPVLPDDYASNDPGRISAIWKDIEQPKSPDVPQISKIDQTASESGRALATRRYTKSELDSLVRSSYSPSTRLTTDVSPRSDVWIHLTRDHGFSSDQVSGMEFWVGMALNDAAHKGMITAWKPAVFPVSKFAKSQASGSSRMTGFKLFTSDGSFRCPACDQQKTILNSGGLLFDYETIRVPSGGSLPRGVGVVPCWQSPNGKTLVGVHQISQLNDWAVKNPGHRPDAAPASPAAPADIAAESSVPPVTEVDLEAKTSTAILQAIAAHVQRIEERNSGKSNPIESAAVGGAVQSWLPEIDIDVDDGLLKILDGLLAKDGYTAGGLTVGWPASAGKRSIQFSPALAIRFRKILEVDVEIKSVSIEGRTVTLNLTGRFLSTLVVRLK